MSHVRTRVTPVGRVCIGLAAFVICAPGIAAADAFSEFRVPVHHVMNWHADFRLSGSTNLDNSGDQSSDNNGLGGSFGTNFDWLADSDALFTRIMADFDFSGARNRTERNRLPLEETRRDQSALENWSLTVSQRLYPWSPPIGLAYDIRGTGNYQQHWHSIRDVSVYGTPSLAYTQELHSADGVAINSLTFSPTLGVGRVRDATPVYDAYVVETRLRKTGALTRPLSHDARQEQIDLLYVRGRLLGTRDRGARRLWSELERILADDGALRGGGLSAEDVFRAGESQGSPSAVTLSGISTSPIARPRGGFVGLGVSGSGSRDSHHYETDRHSLVTEGDSVLSTSSFSFESTARDRQSGNSGNAGGEYHLPIGPQWQCDAYATVRMPFSANERWLRLDASAQLTYLVADQWLAGVGLAHRWYDEVRTTGPTPYDRAQWSVSLSANYFIEDHVYLTADVSQAQDWTRGDPSDRYSYRYLRTTGFSIALSYRILGRFDAAGLLPNGIDS